MWKGYSQLKSFHEDAYLMERESSAQEIQWIKNITDLCLNHRCSYIGLCMLKHIKYCEKWEVDVLRQCYGKS